MSHTYITTAHTLLKDVENPIPKYADKRKRDDWTNTPIFKSGMRKKLLTFMLVINIIPLSFGDNGWF